VQPENYAVEFYPMLLDESRSLSIAKRIVDAVPFITSHHIFVHENGEVEIRPMRFAWEIPIRPDAYRIYVEGEDMRVETGKISD
jgi:hypothetical protein